jgi:hypothetical protein
MIATDGTGLDVSAVLLEIERRSKAPDSKTKKDI